MLKQIISRGFMGLLLLAIIFAFNYFVKIDVAWRLKSAEAQGGQTAAGAAGPTIHSEEAHSAVNMEEETYILYSDLDVDGDLDIAYTTNSPIRFIENKTVDSK